jgi:hypothetical protein
VQLSITTSPSVLIIDPLLRSPVNLIFSNKHFFNVISSEPLNNGEVMVESLYFYYIKQINNKIN